VAGAHGDPGGQPGASGGFLSGMALGVRWCRALGRRGRGSCGGGRSPSGLWRLRCCWLPGDCGRLMQCRLQGKAPPRPGSGSSEATLAFCADSYGPKWLSSCCRGEFLDHRQKQLSVAVIEVRGITPDLREEAELVVGEFLRLELTSQCVFCKQLCKWHFERTGDLREGVQRRNGMPFSTLDK